VMERLIRSMVPGTMAVLDLEDGYLVCGGSGSDQWEWIDVCAA
jgi:hypothetical protein